MPPADLFKVVLQDTRLHDVLPSSLLKKKKNSNPRQKALALLGDRLIDLKLYEQLLLEGESHEGYMTQTRSMLVANSNLARCGQLLFVPYVVSKFRYDNLSMHERGTMVEAYVGALYEQCNYRITQELSIVLESMISQLRSFLTEERKEDRPLVSNNGLSLGSSQFEQPNNLKKAKSVLLEIMQKRGVTNAASFFVCRSLSSSKAHPPFVATFEPSIDMSSCNLPNTGPVTGDKSISKKEAEESCSSKVLEIFREKEKDMKVGPEYLACKGASLMERSAKEKLRLAVENQSSLGKRNMEADYYSGSSHHLKYSCARKVKRRDNETGTL